MNDFRTCLTPFLWMTLLATSISSPALAQSNSSLGALAAAQLGNAPTDKVSVEEYKNLEAALISGSPSALEQFIQFANYKLKTRRNGMASLNLNLKFSSKLPPGKITSVEMPSSDSGKVQLQITVHEAVKTNPYFLLEALVDINNFYNISDLSFSDTVGIALPEGGYKYNTTNYNLQYSIGLLFEKFKDFNTDQSPIEVMETLVNADAGSIFSKRRLVDLERQNFQIIKDGFSKFTPLRHLTETQKQPLFLEYAKAKGVILSSQNPFEAELQKYQDQVELSFKKKLAVLTAEAKKVYHQQIQDYKALAQERNNIVSGKSLSEMVKANDREGVAQAMEKMLPWSIMEPTEKRFWTDFVESVRRPDYTNAPILFRGMDSDERLQALMDHAGNVTGGGLFSKRLTAGSGSHFFKLKGLPDTFEAFGTNGVRIEKRLSPLTIPHTLTKMMLNHASNPNGSPFISLTYSLETAYQFGTSWKSLTVKNEQGVKKAQKEFLKSNSSGGVVTLRMDPRRLLTNSISHHTSEVEVLASLLIFPDEVLHLEKGVSYYMEIGDNSQTLRHEQVFVPLDEYYARAREAVYQKTGQLLPENYLAVTKQGKTQFVLGLNELGNLFERVSMKRPMRCENIF